MIPADLARRRFGRHLPYVLLLVGTHFGVLFLGGCMDRDLAHTVQDRTGDKIPAKAFAQARRAVDRPIVYVRRWDFGFSSKKVYSFWTDRSGEHAPWGQYVLLMSKDDRFVEVNCQEGLPALREIMQDYPFARKDFWDRQKLNDFLETILHLSALLPGHIIASGLFLEEIEKDPNGVATWSVGKAADESVFRNLCHDPGLAMDRNDWVIVFNVLTPDGGAEVWRVIGIWDPRSETNTFEKIERFPLFDRGTFGYVMYGG